MDLKDIEVKGDRAALSKIENFVKLKTFLTFLRTIFSFKNILRPMVNFHLEIAQICDLLSKIQGFQTLGAVEDLSNRLS